MSDTDTEPPQPLFDRTAGVEFFESLVDRFYEGVMADPVLAPLYEVDDIDGARHRLTMFLVQYFGGPTTYNDERGHPRLRMRHAPYAIGELERDRWLVHMRDAVAQARALDGVSPQDADSMLAYFDMAADHMVNTRGLRFHVEEPPADGTSA